MKIQRKAFTASSSILATNVVLRKTYLLLAATLLFSTLTATFSLLSGAPPLNPFIVLLGYFGLLFLVNMLRNNPVASVVAVFALTGFMGYTLGPILSGILRILPNGEQIIATALGGTATIFFTLSAYVLVTKKDFSYLGGFLMAAMTIAFLAGLGAMVFKIPMLSLIVSGAFALLSSGVILFQTSAIIHGGERNYIMATVTLYVALFNLFISLLQILSIFSGNNRN